jgi:hypothetical protein
MRPFYAAIIAHVVASYAALGTEALCGAVPFGDGHDALYIALFPAFSFLLFPYYLTELTQRRFEARPACVLLTYVVALLLTYFVLRTLRRKHHPDGD